MTNYSQNLARDSGKSNRNTIIKVTGVFHYGGFKWMTLGQIKTLLKLDNVVNMDTRSVISGIAYPSTFVAVTTKRFFASVNKYASIEAINSFFGAVSPLTHLKFYLGSLN